jgi:hypothetical protein
VQRANPVIHQMTDLRAAPDLHRFDESFAVTNRLRTEGLDHLLAAARYAGVKRLVAQSFCGWPFARVGGRHPSMPIAAMFLGKAVTTFPILMTLVGGAWPAQ